MDDDRTVTLLDYGAGNVLSLRNALTKLNWRIHDVKSAHDVQQARRLVFPGVGSFRAAMDSLASKQLLDPLRDYLRSGRPFLGICIGMQVLFESSEEGDAPGLGVIPGRVERFAMPDLPVPHIGWNSLALARDAPSASSTTSSSSSPTLDDALAATLSGNTDEKFYFVHSFRVLPNPQNAPYIRSVTDYGERFISSVQRGNMFGTQFHPEKSSSAGLKLIECFLNASLKVSIRTLADSLLDTSVTRVLDTDKTELSKRIIACLDVRNNDAGDLVVTKGDQYDVREKLPVGSDGKGGVRNLGKPVELARNYYEQGADEITFLNICQFRAEPLGDLPLLKVLEETSSNVFVPLCVGGGIRDYVDAAGKKVIALEIATAYFRSGADKISIGSDAVLAALDFYANAKVKSGTSCIEQISRVYGAQAVVVSVDPRRVWLHAASDAAEHAVIESHSQVGPQGQRFCWWECTIKGGREGSKLDVVQLCQAVEELGAGEILLNSMDADGQKKGYDIELLQQVCAATSLPVIASSGAGIVQHFSQVFSETSAQAALAAGIFHRKEVPLDQVKQHLKKESIPVRL